MNESAILELEEVHGKRIEQKVPMLPTFIETLETVCDLGSFPSAILQELVKSGIHSPHLLINTFGGGLFILAKHMVYMKVSLFIEQYPSITRRLFAVSRTILGYPFLIEMFFHTNGQMQRKQKIMVQSST